MSIICTKLGGTDATNGQLADVDNVVDTFDAAARGVLLIGSVYTGTGFNASQSDTGTTTNNTTIALTAANLLYANYVEVVLNYSASSSNSGATSGSANIKIERNETGQSSWSTVINPTVTASSGIATSSSSDNSGGCIHAIITLTSGEKTNGIDIKITGTANASGAGGSASVSNAQTFFRCCL